MKARLKYESLTKFLEILIFIWETGDLYGYIKPMTSLYVCILFGISSNYEWKYTTQSQAMLIEEQSNKICKRLLQSQTHFLFCFQYLMFHHFGQIREKWHCYFINHSTLTVLRSVSGRHFLNCGFLGNLYHRA